MSNDTFRESILGALGAISHAISQIDHRLRRVESLLETLQEGQADLREGQDKLIDLTELEYEELDKVTRSINEMTENLKNVVIEYIPMSESERESLLNN